MKIVAGLGSLDEYIRFCDAGADEFFAGYVPYEWNQKYGTTLPLNRREVLCSNVQLGSFSELEILADMVRKYGKPVHLTFNALYYIPEQYPKIAAIIRRCMKLGFCSYILADPALIEYLKEQKINCEIHLSGETGEVNSRMLSVFQKYPVQRLIFHRKNSFDDMERVVKYGKNPGRKMENRAGTVMEYEAFVLNELCHFTGAFCNSLHCDEMGYLCRVPYRLGPVKNPDRQVRQLGEQLEGGADGCRQPPYEEDGYLCGATGCGLCALYRLRQAGITHLKLVGRGNYTDFMERDIRNLKRALALLEESGSEVSYKEKMKQELFPKGCSRNCYYREIDGCVQ